MKMSRPTKVTMTSMTAVRGSSIQPRESHSLPNWNQRKLKVSGAWVGRVRVWAKAASESRNDAAMEPMASVAARGRLRCGAREIMPAAKMGSAGMSQRMGTIWIIAWVCSASHGVHLVQVSGVVVAIGGDDDGESDGCLCGGDGDGEDGKED